MPDEPAQEPQVRHKPEDERLVERAREACEGHRPILAMGHDLRQHRIEAAADLVALGHPGVDPDALPRGPAKGLDPAGRREEPRLGVLGVETDLDGVTGRPHILLVEGERLPGGDPELVRDQISPRHELGHRVFDLEAGVHLQEVGTTPIVEQELHRPGRLVADGACEPECRLRHLLANVGRHSRRGRLLEDLLVAALDRTVALAEVDALAVGIEEHLHLDVSRALHVPLEHQPVVAERCGRLAPSSRQRVVEPVEVADDPHALAPAPGSGLDEKRQADRGSGLLEGTVGLVVAVVTGHDRNVEAGGQPASCRLVAHRPDRRRRGTDPADAGRDDRFRERGVLGQEPEPRVERVGAGRPRGLDDRLRVEQVESAGAVGGRDHGHDPALPAGAGDPGRDLAAIGDEQYAKVERRPRRDGVERV